MRAQEKHGDSPRGTYKRLYRIWSNMKNRCQNIGESTDSKYERYKNISVCDEWQLYSVFKTWALTNGYNSGLSIDRINNLGNYEPSNCRWATQSTQTRNINIQKNNKSGFRGVRKRKDTGKWNAYIYVNSKNKSLGCFDSDTEAAKVRDLAIIEYGLESPLNFT